MRDPASKREQNAARILLVEDNLDGILVRRCLLEEIGCTVVTARTGCDALAKFENEEPFDLVVTDFRMPQMGGAELVMHLREQGYQRPIILVSGFANTLDLQKEVPGATVVIQKSANEAVHLTRAVKKLLIPKKPMGSLGSKSGKDQTGIKGKSNK
ncbi:MAG TPA: response regulator [Bryobacteraceae bacterium]|jgi:CheY-like chemotaxis protein|nr:response regulator [Bryobacteraceae bacterium]